MLNRPRLIGVAAAMTVALWFPVGADAALRDFSVAKKVVSSSNEGDGVFVFRSKILSRPGGRVIGSSVNRGLGEGRFVARYMLEAGTILVRGRIQVVTPGDPGFSRITGGTGAFEGASGREYSEDLKGDLTRRFFDFNPLERP